MGLGTKRWKQTQRKLAQSKEGRIELKEEKGRSECREKKVTLRALNQYVCRIVAFT